MAVNDPILRAVRVFAGVGSLTVGGSALVALLVGVGAYRAQRAAHMSWEVPAPRASGMFGAEFDGKPIELAMIGDSLALGVGAGKSAQTIGAILAHGLSTLAARPVMLYNVAETGSESKDLPTQLSSLRRLTAQPDVAVVIVGGNDVMQRAPIPVSARFLYRAVLDLRATGCRVVVATCPDMGTVRP